MLKTLLIMTALAAPVVACGEVPAKKALPPCGHGKGCFQSTSNAERTRLNVKDLRSGYERAFSVDELTAKSCLGSWATRNVEIYRIDWADTEDIAAISLAPREGGTVLILDARNGLDRASVYPLDPLNNIGAAEWMVMRTQKGTRVGC